MRVSPQQICACCACSRPVQQLQWVLGAGALFGSIPVPRVVPDACPGAAAWGAACHEALRFPTCQLKWGLRLRVLHQQEGSALACVRRASKPDIPGEEPAGLLGSVPHPPFPSLISPISFLLDFSLPHLRFLEEGGWERKFSVRTFSTTLHFYCA